jgi:radical SAM superfamily enzyme YgiQ (UPF0313 family)
VRIALVAPKTVDQPFKSFPTGLSPGESPEIPLGTVAAAAVLKRAGFAPKVYDLNFQPGLEPSAENWAGVLANENCQWFGFGTICSSYPFTIRIVKALKQLRPEARILLAGPQASVVDVSTLERFSVVDLIIRGEVEQNLVPALESFGTPAARLVPGITFRSGARVERAPDGPVITDLDAIPEPCFELLEYCRDYRVYPVEAGRGCPFSCTFCSTNDFFRRKFRLRSPACVLREMDRLAAAYSVRIFDLVHDMFTVDRKRVVAFCDAMREAGRDYIWTCSARTDCVDEPLLELMWQAGCRGLFFGVESGSPRLQRSMDKCLDIEEALRAVRASTGRGIQTTVAFITGFPDEDRSDLEATLRFALQSAQSPHARVQLTLLAPLAGTPIWQQHRHELLYDGNISDISVSRRQPDAGDSILIRKYPELFPNFYGFPTVLERSVYVRANRFVTRLLRDARWLALAIEQECDSLLSLLESWWKQADAMVCPQFREYISTQLTGPKVMCILEYEKAIGQIASAETAPTGKSCPRLSAHCGLFHFGFDLSAVVAALESGNLLPKHAACPSWTLLERSCSGIVYTMMPPAGVYLIQLCDGLRTPARIADEFSAIYPEIEGTPGYALAEAALADLHGRGVIGYEHSAAAGA